MLDITIYESEKAPFNATLSDGTIFNGQFTVEDKDDADDCYSVLAQGLHVADDDLIDFQYLDGDDVKTFLEAAKQANFISDYEIEETEEN